MNNLIADVNWRLIVFERVSDDFDRTNGGSIKSARLRQNDFREICLALERMTL